MKLPRLPRRGDVVLVFRGQPSGEVICKVRLRKDEYASIERAAKLYGETIESLIDKTIADIAKSSQ